MRKGANALGRKNEMLGVGDRGYREKASFHGLKDCSRPPPMLFGDTNPQGKRRNCGKVSTIPLAHISYRK